MRARLVCTNMMWSLIRYAIDQDHYSCGWVTNERPMMMIMRMSRQSIYRQYMYLYVHVLCHQLVDWSSLSVGQLVVMTSRQESSFLLSQLSTFIIKMDHTTTIKRLFQSHYRSYHYFSIANKNWFDYYRYNEENLTIKIKNFIFCY